MVLTELAEVQKHRPWTVSTTMNWGSGITDKTVVRQITNDLQQGPHHHSAILESITNEFSHMIWHPISQLDLFLISEACILFGNVL